MRKIPNTELPLSTIKKSLPYLFLLFPFFVKAQVTDTIKEKNIQEVVVKAYEQNRKLKEIPAAVNYVGRSTLDRFAPTSIVQAMNSTPGIRMEERSPGS